MATLSTLSPPPASSPLDPRRHPLLPLLALCRHPTEFAQAHAALTKLALIRHTLFSTRLAAHLALSPSPDAAAYALRLHHLDPRPNTFAFNVLIRGLVYRRQFHLALTLFTAMLSQTKPNSLTFPFVLKACSALTEGQQVHALVCKLGLSSNLFIQNATIFMYLQCGSFSDALRLFDRMPDRDAVSWNTMIDGFVNNGLLAEARELFDKMSNKTTASWNCLINGYAKAGSMEMARELFDRAPAKSTITWNTMLSGYIGADNVEAASELFCRMPSETKDLTTLTVMIDVSMRDCMYRDVLEIFDEMRVLEIEPNVFTLVSALSACSHLAALELGEWICSHVESRRMPVDVVLGTALLHMYAKCGRFERAVEVFVGMWERDVSAWNSMIASSGDHGYAREALTMFFKMIDAGVAPDEVTLLSVLSACRHSGLVEAGRRSLRLMKEAYGISPKSEHFGCMVDLLCRAGMLNDARELLEVSDAKFNVPAWGALLGASNRVGDVEMGEFAARRLLELNPEDMQCYVELSNMYSKEKRWEDAVEVREAMRGRGMEKVPGRSSIDVGGVLHEFRVGSSSDSL